MMADKGFIEILNFMTTRVEVVVSIGDLVERLRFINLLCSTSGHREDQLNYNDQDFDDPPYFVIQEKGAREGGNGKEASRDI